MTRPTWTSLLLLPLLLTACPAPPAAPGGSTPSVPASPGAVTATPTPNPQPTVSAPPWLPPDDAWPTLTIAADRNLLLERVFKPAFAQLSTKESYVTLEMTSTLTNGGKDMRQVLVYAASPVEATGWFYVLDEGSRLRVPVADGNVYVGLIDESPMDNGGTATVTVLDDLDRPVGHAVVDGRRHVVTPQAFAPATVTAPGGVYTVDVDTTLDFGPGNGRVLKVLLVAKDSVDANGWYMTAAASLGSRVRLRPTTLYATLLAPDAGVTGSARLRFR